VTLGMSAAASRRVSSPSSYGKFVPAYARVAEPARRTAFVR
jgi:hypothetical protein